MEDLDENPVEALRNIFASNLPYFRAEGRNSG